MTKNLIIVSAGQYGRETLGWAIQAIEHGADFRMKGFVDDRPNILDGFDYEFKILGLVHLCIPIRLGHGSEMGPAVFIVHSDR